MDDATGGPAPLHRLGPAPPCGPAVRLMCALAVRGAFRAHVVPAFEAAGGRASIVWAPTAVIMARIAAGETADAVIVLAEAMDRLAADGLVAAESRVAIARSRCGVAVRAGAPHPEIATVEALSRALVRARSVAYSRTGASGIFFAGLIRRLGIAGAVDARATVIPEGFTAERLVSGEADIAVQQVSELMAVPGVEVVGPLPDGAQEESVFCAGLVRGGRGAEGFLAGLTTPAAAEAYRASGLEPAF